MGFVRRNGGWIALDSPFLGAEQFEALHGSQDPLPLAEVEQRRGAASEKDRARFQVVMNHLDLTDQRLDVTLDDRAVRGFGVKGAIFALVRAEGDVEVETGDRWPIC